jgi:hypothetical protein
LSCFKQGSREKETKEKKRGKRKQVRREKAVNIEQRRKEGGSLSLSWINSPWGVVSLKQAIPLRGPFLPS